MEDISATKKNVCDCVHHRTIPALVVIFGLLFLLLNVHVLTDEFVSLAWPIVVIAAGATKYNERRCKCC
jgi:hypothetical protein